MKAAFSAALRFYLPQQREMRERVRAGYALGYSGSKKSVRASEEEGSHLLAHREEKGTDDGTAKKDINMECRGFDS